MKKIMTDHVENAKHGMFQDATNSVKQRLTEMVRTVEEEMANHGDLIFNMCRDYMAVLGGAHIREGDLMPRYERLLRKTSSWGTCHSRRPLQISSRWRR
jgi:hypothetical protein